MKGIKTVNLSAVIDELGEDETKKILAGFSCPMNPDVEEFLKNKAVDFAKQGISVTHLVMMPHKGNAVLAGYFTLANKYITVFAKKLSSALKKRLARFSVYDPKIRAYCLSAPLLAQLGKNYANGYNGLIDGDTLLKIACDKIRAVQYDLGGRFAYVECEQKRKLIDFYKRNGFYEFDVRELDKDETGIEGGWLTQLLRYMR